MPASEPGISAGPLATFEYLAKHGDYYTVMSKTAVVHYETHEGTESATFTVEEVEVHADDILETMLWLRPHDDDLTRNDRCSIIHERGGLIVGNIKSDHGERHYGVTDLLLSSDPSDS